MSVCQIEYLVKKREDYRKSEFQITRGLSDHDEWTFKKIDERSKQLAEEACKIWSLKEN